MCRIWTMYNSDFKINDDKNVVGCGMSKLQERSTLIIWHKICCYYLFMSGFYISYLNTCPRLRVWTGHSFFWQISITSIKYTHFKKRSIYLSPIENPQFLLIAPPPHFHSKPYELFNLQLKTYWVNTNYTKHNR